MTRATRLLILTLFTLLALLSLAHAASYCCLNASSTNYCHTLHVSKSALDDLCSADSALTPERTCQDTDGQGAPLYPACVFFCCCNVQDGSVIPGVDTYEACDQQNGRSIPNLEGGACTSICQSVKLCDAIPEPSLDAHVTPGTGRVTLTWQACQPQAVELCITPPMGTSQCVTDQAEPSLLTNTYTADLSAYPEQDVRISIRIRQTDGSITQEKRGEIIVNIGRPDACQHAPAFDTPFCIGNEGFVCTSEEGEEQGTRVIRANILTTHITCPESLTCHPNFKTLLPECTAQSVCTEKTNPLGETTPDACENTQYEGETIPSGCYADRDEQGRLSCFSCERITHCSAYHSRAACEQDACGIGNCAWHALGQGTGEGVCISTTQNVCREFTLNPQGEGENTGAYTPLVEAVTLQNAPFNKGDACSTDQCPGYTCDTLSPRACNTAGGSVLSFASEFDSTTCPCLSDQIGMCTSDGNGGFTRVVNGETPCTSLTGMEREACERDLTPPSFTLVNQPSAKRILLSLTDNIQPSPSWPLTLHIYAPSGDILLTARAESTTPLTLPYAKLNITTPGAYTRILELLDPVGNTRRENVIITYMARQEPPVTGIQSRIDVTYEQPEEGLENGTSLLTLHLLKLDETSSVELQPSSTAFVRITPTEQEDCNLITSDAYALTKPTITLRELADTLGLPITPGREYTFLYKAYHTQYNLEEDACHQLRVKALPPYTPPIRDEQPPRTILTASYTNHEFAIRLTIQDKRTAGEAYTNISTPYEKGYATRLTLTTPDESLSILHPNDTQSTAEIISGSMLEEIFNTTLIPLTQYTLTACTTDPAGNEETDCARITFYPPNPDAEGVRITLLTPKAARAGEAFTIHIRTSEPGEACTLTSDAGEENLTYHPEGNYWESKAYTRTTDFTFTITCTYNTSTLPTGAVKQTSFTIPIYNSPFKITSLTAQPNPVFSLTAGAYRTRLIIMTNHLALCSYSVNGSDKSLINTREATRMNTSLSFHDPGVYSVHVTCRDVFNSLAEDTLTIRTGVQEDWITLDAPRDAWYNTSRVPLRFTVPAGSVCSATLTSGNTTRSVMKDKTISTGVYEGSLSTPEGRLLLNLTCTYTDSGGAYTTSHAQRFAVDTTPPRVTLLFENTTRDVTRDTPGANLTITLREAHLKRLTLTIIRTNQSNTSMRDAFTLSLDPRTGSWNETISPKSPIWAENTLLTALLIAEDFAGNRVTEESENTLSFAAGENVQTACGKPTCEEGEPCLRTSECAEGLTCTRNGTSIFSPRVCLPPSEKKEGNTTRENASCTDPIRACGGACEPCGLGGACTSDEDCRQGVCDTGVCTDKDVLIKQALEENGTPSTSRTRLATTYCMSDDECAEGEYCDVESKTCLPLQRGSSWLVWLLIPLLLAIAGAAAWYVYQQQNQGKKDEEDDTLSLTLPPTLPPTHSSSLSPGEGVSGGEASSRAQPIPPTTSYASAAAKTHRKHDAEREKLLKAFETSLLDKAEEHEQKETKREKKYKDLLTKDE